MARCLRPVGCVGPNNGAGLQWGMWRVCSVVSTSLPNTGGSAHRTPTDTDNAEADQQECGVLLHAGHQLQALLHIAAGDFFLDELGSTGQRAVRGFPVGGASLEVAISAGSSEKMMIFSTDLEVVQAIWHRLWITGGVYGLCFVASIVQTGCRSPLLSNQVAGDGTTPPHLCQLSATQHRWFSHSHGRR